MNEPEPRFAGQVTPRAQPAAPPPPPPPWSSGSEMPTAYPPVDGPPPPPPPNSPPPEPPAGPPMVDYGADLDSQAELLGPQSTRYRVPAGAPPIVAMLGAVLAVIGSVLTWVTLNLDAATPNSEEQFGNPPRITYNGLSLLEGRVLLVLGILAAAVSFALALRRLRERVAAAVLIGIGLAGLTVTAFSIVGHPSELSTLLRTEEQTGTVTVSLPNGAGGWLAMAGAALILVGGLLGYLRRQQHDRSA